MAKLTLQQRLHRDNIEEKVKSFPSYIEEYKDDMYSGNCSPSTLWGYLSDFEKFFNWLMAEGLSDAESLKEVSLSTLEKLRLKEVDSYFSHLKTREELNEKTINRKKSSLKSLFKFLTERTEDDNGECYFYRNVMAKVKISKPKESLSSRAEIIGNNIYHDEDMYNFLSFIDKDYEHKLLSNNSKQQYRYFKRDKERDIAIMALLIFSGLRVSELANLTLANLNLQQAKMKVLRKGSNDEIVHFLPEAIPYIQDYLSIRTERYRAPSDEEFVFLTLYQGVAKPISIRALQNLVYKYTLAFKGDKLSPHKLRHTFATEYAKSNGLYDLMRQLGHTSTEVSSLYVNSSDKEAQAAINRMRRQSD
ncbi:tyrosine recombinase XerS [Pontibacillus halophilus]|uniref:tyrosine recombinase XerS n=1 Tax=Pontibacillus halophilus TaxID=516704 RepID=UPI0004146366|nr:tyrosine recombinase XerS [Pontibacillus halophilus]